MQIFSVIYVSIDSIEDLNPRHFVDLCVFVSMTYEWETLLTSYLMLDNFGLVLKSLQ